MSRQSQPLKVPSHHTSKNETTNKTYHRISTHLESFCNLSGRFISFSRSFSFGLWPSFSGSCVASDVSWGGGDKVARPTPHHYMTRSSLLHASDHDIESSNLGGGLLSPRNSTEKKENKIGSTPRFIMRLQKRFGESEVKSILKLSRCTAAQPNFRMAPHQSTPFPCTSGRDSGNAHDATSPELLSPPALPIRLAVATVPRQEMILLLASMG